jgi:hypothetical protein
VIFASEIFFLVKITILKVMVMRLMQPQTPIFRKLLTKKIFKPFLIHF